MEETYWGFDGLTVPERINVFSVLLVNGSSKSFEGPVRLQKHEATGEARGACLAQQCYIGPLSSRWVQFYPYVSAESEEWVLKVGTTTQSFQAPKLGPPAMVYLKDPDDPLSITRGLKPFPEDLFPPTVGGADALRAVALDHSPQWEAPRREAFLDWLRAGGEAHILHGPAGTHPEFTGELSVLNDPRERFHVGAGLVVRHDVSSRQANRELFVAGGPPWLSLETSEDYYPGSTETAFFRELKSLSKPQHNWGLIYLCLLLYVGIAGPVNYIVAKVHKKGFIVPVGVFLSAVAVFSLILVILGRRGAGERAAVHTLTYARPIAGGTYDVTQWSNVFVISGDWYTIAHPGTHNIYSDCQDTEAVNGVTVCGRDGSFQVDIPLYSARPFLHRAKMKGPELGLRVSQLEAGARLEKLEVETGAGFPESPLEMWALHGNQFYPVRRSGDRLELSSRTGTDVPEFLSKESLSVLQHFGPYGFAPSAQPVHEVFPKLERPLIARAIGGAEATRYRFAPPRTLSDRVQLFVFTRSDSDFRMEGSAFPNQVGYVLYHVDLFPPEGTDG